jgi:hypothetical protein
LKLSVFCQAEFRLTANAGRGSKLTFIYERDSRDSRDKKAESLKLKAKSKERVFQMKL